MKICIVLWALSISIAFQYQACEKSSTEEVVKRNDHEIFLIRGAEGGEAFKVPLNEALKNWQEVAARAGLRCRTFSDKNSRKNIISMLQSFQKPSSTVAWVVYLGHGTYINHVPKLNLVGEDITADEMFKHLDTCQRPLIFINCSSSSAPFLSKLSAPGRVIISATRTGGQKYYTKFNEMMATAIANPKADLDKDGQVSLFESYLFASRQVSHFYVGEGRVPGETALLDDNGDKLGVKAEYFRGLTAINPDKKLDGILSHQVHLIPSEIETKMSQELRKKRNILEMKLHQLKLEKLQMDEKEYYKKLEEVLKKIAKIYKTD